MVTEEVMKEVETGLKRSTKSQALDGFLYNGGVVFTLVCTGAATIIGAVNNTQNPAIPLWAAPLLSGIATIWVGIDRALQFGNRWIFHRSISAEHRILKHRLVSLNLLPESKRAEELEAIHDAWIALPRLYPNVPGVPSPETGSSPSSPKDDRRQKTASEDRRLRNGRF